jgi:hypothetical protein
VPEIKISTKVPPVSTPEKRAVRPLGLAPEQVQLVVDDPLSLDTRDDAAELVRALPVQSFVAVTRKLRDEERLDLVLPYASPEQITGLFDLDAWSRDRLAIPRARAWLDRIVDAYEQAEVERGRLTDLLHDTDAELWIIATAAATAVAEFDEPDDDERRQQVMEDMAALRTWETPDGFSIIGVPDNEFGRMSLRVLSALYEDNMVEGRKLITAIKWSVHSEVEEDLLRWRKGRLADLGFPEWDEAMRLFTPLARDAVIGRSTPDDEAPSAHVPVDLPPAQLGRLGTDVLRRVMQRLDDDEYDLRLREFLLLANELMAAQRFEPGDETLQERAVGQAQATLNLACELLLTGEPQEDPEAYIAERIARVGLRKLFRFGYGPLAKLRKAALALHRDGRVSLSSVGSLLDRPWGPTLASLSHWYPEMAIEGKAGTRPIPSLRELARATALIGEAGALARVTFASEGFAIDPVWLSRVDEPEHLHLGDLVRTALICEQLPGVSTQADGLRPLGPGDIAWAVNNLLESKQLVARVEQSLRAKLSAIAADDRADALVEVLLPRLNIELAGVEWRDDGSADLTKISGLLTVQQVGMWIKVSLGDAE